MPDPTNVQITRALAEICGITLFRIDEDGRGTTECGTLFDPLGCRNDLAEVLEELTIDQRRVLNEHLCQLRGPCMIWDYNIWLLTLDHAIIARAVAEVVSK